MKVHLTLHKFLLFLLLFSFCGGGLAIEKNSKFYISDMLLTPDVESHSVLVQVYVYADHSRKANLRVSCEGGANVQRMYLSKGQNVLKMRLPLNDKVELWNEFHPSLCTIKGQLDGIGSCEKVFGMRDFAIRKGQLEINGQKAFLRGVEVGEECRLFSLDEWWQYFEELKDCGYNTLVFDNFVPSESALGVADSLGLYLCAGNEEIADSCRQYVGHPSYLYGVDKRLLHSVTKKEEVEMCLRNSSCIGFYTIFSRNDIAGTGVLSPIVPVVTLERTAWTTDEVLVADVCVFNYSEEKLAGEVVCELDGCGVSIEKSFSDVSVSCGSVSETLHFSFPLTTVFRSGELMFKVKYLDYHNESALQISLRKRKR